MQPSQIRTSMATTIKAVVLTKHGPGDRFVVLAAAREPEQVIGRAVMIKLIGGGQDEANTCARFVTYQVVVFYEPSDDIDNRIADDSRLLDDGLWTLQTAHADITEVAVSDFAVSEDAGRIATRRDVRVVYQHE